jgi:hypothetical protein
MGDAPSAVASGAILAISCAGVGLSAQKLERLEKYVKVGAAVRRVTLACGTYVIVRTATR